MTLTGVEFDDDNTYSDGKFQPKVAGYYQVNAQVNGNSGGPMTIVRLFDKDDNTIANGSYDSLDGTENFAKLSNVSTIVYLNGVDDCIKLAVRIKGTTTGPHGVTKGVEFTSMSAHLITGQSTGGGSGGGSYTPEKMVWSGDLSASSTGDRLPETVYTNDNDVPLYVQIYTSSTDPDGNVLAFIDDEFFGRVGKAGSNSAYDMPLFLVPSGSTYEFREEDGAKIQRWREAKMPVAVGTGGTTPLLYKSVTPNNIDNVTSKSWTPLTGKLTANVVAGKRYIITGGTNAVTPNLDGVNVFSYWKLATVLNGGTAEDTLCNMVTGSPSSSGGTGSYSPMERSFTYNATESGTLELTAYCKMAGAGTSCSFQNNGIRIQEVAETTGSGGSGDSIWSDVDGDAVLETDGKKLTIDANVAELGAKARITTDTNSLEFNVGSGSVPEMTIASDGAVVTTGKVTVGESLSVAGNGVFQASMTAKDLPTVGPASTPNLHINANGAFYKTSWAGYSVEEVDKKLAIKDKLIEKLSARLDKLEKKVK